MRSAILGFVAGIAWLQMQAQLLSFAGHVALFAAAVLLCWIGWRISGDRVYKLLRVACFSVAGLCFGFAWGGVYAQHYLDEELPTAWEGRDVTVVGTIDSLPARFAHGIRFHFRVEKIVPQGQDLPVLPSRLALSWYDEGGFGGLLAADGMLATPFALSGAALAPQVQPGERWQLTVRLKRAHGNANPHGFDYEVWLLEQKLRATGNVRADRQLPVKNQRLDAFIWRPGHVVEYCRAWLRERILMALPRQPYAGVIVALVLGDQGIIERDDWTIFNRTGIGHLVAISGLHISMVAGLFAALGGFLWRRSFFTRAQLPLRLPAPKVAVLTGLMAALLYVLLAGCGIPAQRSLYMLVVIGVAYWTGRLMTISYVMLLALALVLLIDPWALLWPGFWLSFSAVALILYASTGRVGSHTLTRSSIMRPAAREQRPSRWLPLGRTLRAAATTQYVVTLGLLPLTILLFGQCSLVSPLANAVAIPLVTLLVTPLSLLGSVLPAPLSDWALLAAHGLVAWLARWLSWLSSQSFAVWRAPLPSLWMFVMAMAGVVLLLAPRGWPARWLGWFGWLPVLLNEATAPAPGQLQITAFDVGQGMALLVETSQHRLLYDTGPSYGTRADAGNRVIVPYLRARGIHHLDVVVVSHSDIDHAGGALSLFGEMTVGRVYSSLPLTSRIVQAAPDHRRCLAGQQWHWDGVQLDMLYPVQTLYDSGKWKPNALSCVLKVTLGQQAILLPGDIEAPQEAQLINRSAALDLRADVMLAPHHGSGTSSTIAFLQAVRPSVALFQQGYRNRYHHPKHEVIVRYASMGIRRLRSDEAGAIMVRFDGTTWKVDTYRQTHARYWYGR